MVESENTQGLMVNSSIFRQYDIRGVWGSDLTPDVAELLGRAFGTYAMKSLGKTDVTMTVGRDVRLSSGPLCESLVSGLLSTGSDVVDIGECPTPVQYFSLYHLDADGGVMITGSHNPPEYNGFKMSVGRETIYGDSIQSIKGIINGGSFCGGKGRKRNLPILDEYAAHLQEGFEDLAGMRVVIDAGNGTAGLAAPRIMKSLGVDVVELFCEPDGRFPNHHPDPVVKGNLAALIAEVKRSGADLGIAYDGDADRLGVVDAGGEIIWGDRLMVIFARDILKENPGASIIGEVKCSQVMYDDIKKRGGNAVMWKTGHSLIKKKMKEDGALLAGEMSGHIFFADRYFGYDDAIYASLRLLEIIRKNGKPYDLRRLLLDLPVVASTPEIRVDCDDASKFGIIEKIREAFSDYQVNTIDGARITFAEGWALVRASNTQPALVLRFEASDTAALSRIRTLVEQRLALIMGNQPHCPAR
jgi:phosphomannomutase/phosphoglucomutase